MPLVTFTKNRFTLRKFLRISARIFLSILLLLIIVWGLLQTEWGQNWLARQVTSKLSKDLQSKISIKHVSIGFFNRLELKGVLIEDQKQDTLLYAGELQLRITDWFFFKEKADIKYVNLQNAVIHLNRTDSVWNYDFLEKYFASSGSGQKKAGIEFNLKKAELTNVVFVKKDAWIGSDLHARFRYLNIDADVLSLTQKIIDVNNITLNDPYVHFFNYTGKRPKRVAVTDSIKNKTEQDWTFLVNNISINNGTYKNDWNTLVSTVKGFDGKHIDFNKITGSIKNIRFVSDTMTGNADLSLQERSGLIVKSLKTKMTVHPQAMIFDELYLQTNRSILTNYFSMRYDNIGKMSDFIHSVTMEGNFKQASLASDDIAFFAPTMSDWNRQIKIDGHVKGTVDAIAGENLEISAGNNTYIHGDVSVVGLPNINETLINIQASDLRTTYADAVSFVPALRKVTTPNLAKLSYLRFKGTYTGFVNDFVTYGTLQTALGTMVTDLNMKFPKGAEPVYSGSLATNNFQLGQFINSPQLGLVSFKGNVKGKGLEWKTLDMEVNGKVDKIQYDNYTYQNIDAKGRLSNRLFNGDVVIKDPNADLKLSGIIDLSRAKPLFKVDADIGNIDLRALQLTKDSLVLSGKFKLNIEGSSLSNLIGDARISHATLLHKGKRLSFDSLNISSHYINGIKNFRATSNELDALVTGDFNLETLPQAFTLFLNRYYPSYIKAPRFVKPQAFTFDIRTGIIEDYLKLIDNRLGGLNNSSIKGSLDVSKNNMIIDADVPQFSFNQYQFSDIQLKGSGDFQKLSLTGQVNNARVSDSLVFPQTTFSITAQNDVSDITLNTTANQTINQADLSAQIKTFSDGATVVFNPSSFILNGKTWSIEQGGELNFRKNTVVQGQLILKESNQEIRVYTEPSDIGSWNDLRIVLKDLDLADLSPFLTTKNQIAGFASGEIIVEDPTNKFNISTHNLRFNGLKLDKDSLGNVVAGAEYNNATGLITIKGNNLDPDHKLGFEVSMDIKDPENTFTDRITITPENFQVKILERFIGSLFSDLRGYLTGQLDIVGEGANRNFIGKGRLRGAALKVNFTQVFYTIDDTEIEMKADRIDFGSMVLRDTLGNTATVRGNIRHKGFKDMVFDIEARTGANPMILLNTNYNDNQQFYGKAKGTGSLVLVGPQYDMFMNIDAKASDVAGDSSFLVLPPARARESGQANFMIERKYGREMTSDDYKGSPTNMSYEINVAANPLVNMEVILDELTGDIIRGRGTGNLNISAGTSTPLTMRGRYDIEEGDYLFSFQSFFKRPFILRKGANNFIEWTGDPYDATLHIDAVYKAEDVSFAPLASALPLIDNSSSLNTIREDVFVIATMNGKLFEPEISFKLEFPQNSAINRDPSLTFGIQQLQKNPNELNKQVAFLIVSNSFAPYESGTSSGFNPLQEFTYSTISGLLFNEVNQWLNQLFSKILKNNDFTLNLSGALYNKNLVDANAKGLRINQTDVNVVLGKSFFEGRVQFTLGGTFDVPFESDFIQTLNILPDVTIEVLLNKSGSLRANFFYRESLNALIGDVNNLEKRYGTSVSYNKQFESLFGWLFGRKKHRRGILKTSDYKTSTDSTTTTGGN